MSCIHAHLLGHRSAEEWEEGVQVTDTRSDRPVGPDWASVRCQERMDCVKSVDCVNLHLLHKVVAAALRAISRVPLTVTSIVAMVRVTT